MWSFISLFRNIILFYLCSLSLSFFFLINSVLNARYIKRNGIQSFSGVVPGLVKETDKTQYGALTAEISTGSDTRTDRGLKEGQTRAVREKLQMPFKRRGCLNWVNKERGEGCPRPSVAPRCQKAQQIRKPSSKGQWMSYRGGHTVRRKWTSMTDANHENHFMSC